MKAIRCLAFALSLAISAMPALPLYAQSIDDLIVYIECTAPSLPSIKGSGVLVSADGQVLTARHVLKSGYLCRGTVAASPGTSRELKETKQSRSIPKEFDIAHLRFAAKPDEVFPYMKYCRLHGNLKGKTILGKGYPGIAGGEEVSVRQGILSTVVPDGQGMLQTDVLMAAGMSGGPVLLQDGLGLIGIVAGARFDARSQPQFYGTVSLSMIDKLVPLTEGQNCPASPLSVHPKGETTDARLKSRVLEYIEPHLANSQHRIVVRIIDFNAKLIRDSLSASSSSLDYLKNVGAYSDGGQTVFSHSDLSAIWNDPQYPALQVLYGEITPAGPNGGGQTVRSQVYLGELPKASPAASNVDEFTITSNTELSQYGRLADGHAYLLTYALLLDAIRIDKPDDVLFALIHASSVIYQRLEQGNLLTEEIEKVHASISAISSAM